MITSFDGKFQPNSVINPYLLIEEPIQYSVGKLYSDHVGILFMGLFKRARFSSLSSWLQGKYISLRFADPLDLWNKEYDEDHIKIFLYQSIRFPKDSSDRQLLETEWRLLEIPGILVLNSFSGNHQLLLLLEH